MRFITSSDSRLLLHRCRPQLLRKVRPLLLRRVRPLLLTKQVAQAQWGSRVRVPPRSTGLVLRSCLPTLLLCAGPEVIDPLGWPATEIAITVAKLETKRMLRNENENKQAAMNP